MSAPAVELAGVVVRAGRSTLLGPVDLALGSGEHVLVVGRSGSGKTTLLRAIAGLAVPSAGRIALFGRTASEGGSLTLPPARREVGMVFQRGGLWPHMSVRRHLSFVMRAAGLPRGERREYAARLLDMVELGGLEKRKPGQLSGGEAQRLSLARALATRPRLLLLDEPLGPLDAELRGSLLAHLARLHRELSLTIVHVTHDPDEARHLASRTLRMADGRLEGIVEHATTRAEGAR